MTDIIRHHSGQYESMAIYSPCEHYRYVLHRKWAEGKMVAFIGLNPSTATEEQNDPTVRRCIGYAQAWKFGGMVMLNAFAYRSTDPLALRKLPDPNGPMNDVYLREWATKADMILACYGTHAMYRGRYREVKALLSDQKVYHLGVTKDGHPKHPLYLRANLLPQEWRVR